MKTSKRLVCFIVLFAMVLSLALGFVSPKFSCEVANADFVDEIIENQTEIFSSQFSGYDSEKSSLRPVDIKTGDFLEGSSIMPPANQYGEVSLRTYQVESFNLLANESVFIWIYIPHNAFYELKVSFYGENGEICWKFDDINGLNYLSYLINDNQNGLVGWKLFELKFADSEITGQENETYTGLKISYLAESDEFKHAPIRNKFAFYHIFKAEAMSSTSSSGVFYYQPSVIVVYSDLFKTFSQGLIFVGDKYKFTKSKMLKRLIVNDENVLNSASYSWKIVISNNGFTDNLVVGDEYEFNKVGNYTIKFVLIYGSNSIYTNSFLVECENLNLGKTNFSNLELRKGEETTLEFTISEYLDVQGEVTFDLSDERVAEMTYYESDGKYILKIKAKESGTTNLTVSASAKRESESSYKQYTYTTSINVSKTSDINQFYLKVLLYLAIGLVATLIIYTLILFVKTRRFVVK